MNAVLKPAEYRELLIGCGRHRERRVFLKGNKAPFVNLTTLDVEARHSPDVQHDLNVLPWPFDDNSFDEVHAYEVLEHIGKQGDVKSFFAHFAEIHRILKPEGRLFASTPMWDSPWAWGDPGHVRVICKETLLFLCQDNYKQVGQTAMSDYRDLWKANFEIDAVEETNHIFAFVLRATK